MKNLPNRWVILGRTLTIAVDIAGEAKYVTLITLFIQINKKWLLIIQDNFKERCNTQIAHYLTNPVFHLKISFTYNHHNFKSSQ